MPVNYNFRSRETNELVTLNHVDQQLCDELALTYSDKTFCHAMQWITLAGIAAADSGTVTEESLNAYFAKYEDWSDKEKAIARKYLVELYEFSTWHTVGR